MYARLFRVQWVQVGEPEAQRQRGKGFARQGDAITEALEACFPGFEATSLWPVPDQGADSEVWIADDAWILRRAKRAEVRRWYAKEAQLLPALARALPAQLPKFELLCLEHGLLGYRMIRGEPLADALIERSPLVVGAELGTFIRHLHSFDVAEAHALGALVNPLGVPGSYLTRFGDAPPLRPGATAEQSGWRDVLAYAKSEVVEGFSPHVDAEAGAALAAIFDAVLDDDAALAFYPTVVHTELSSEHMLFDDDARLVGVIDWSDACISDPAADLALALTLPEPAALALIDSYGVALDASLPKRVRVYQSIGAFLHLTHGLLMRSDAIQTRAIQQALTLLIRDGGPTDSSE